MNLESTGRESGVLRRVRIVGADGAWFALLAEWLLADGIEPSAQANGGCDAVLVDIAFPREHGCELLRSLAGEHPGTPIVALSSGFFSNVDCSGPCARELGVAGVLPKPVAREALLDALHKVMPSPR